MTWFSQPLAAWLVGRLSDPSITRLLPAGAASIYRGTRPQAGGAPPRFVSIDGLGNLALVCLPSGKDGLEARVAVQAWEVGDDSDGLAPLAAAIDARLALVDETVGGVHFVSAALGEISGGATSEGVQYVTAGGRYQIVAEGA